MYLSLGCGIISHITKARSRTGAIKPYCSAATLSFCAISTSLTFALAFLCRFPRFSLFLFWSFRFPWWRRTISSDLISNAGWFLMEHSVVSQLCFPFRFDFRCFVTLRTRISVLSNSLRCSSGLTVYQHFKLVVIRGQVVCELLYTTWSVVIRFVA